MSELAAARALLTRLATKSYGSPALPFAMPDVPFDPTATPSYLAVTFVPNRHAAESLGGEFAQHQGLLSVMVVVPKNGGIIKPLTVAKAIQDDWPAQTWVFDAISGLKVVISGKPYLGAILEDETRTSVPVMIPWQAGSLAA